MPLKVPHTRQFSKLPGGTKGSLHPLKLLLSLLHFCLWMFPQRNRPSNDPLMGVCPREIKPAVAEAGTRDRVDQNWSTRTVMFPGESVGRIPEASIFSWFSEAQEKLGGEMQEVRGEFRPQEEETGERHETSLCSSFIFSLAVLIYFHNQHIKLVCQTFK